MAAAEATEEKIEAKAATVVSENLHLEGCLVGCLKSK